MPPLGWKTARPGADLVGEAEQVQLGAQLAVVAAGRLLEQLQVVLERVPGRPGGPVHPLELGVLLGSAPVGGGRTHQLDRADQPGGRQVRAPAQVAPAAVAVLVEVVVDGQLAAAHLHHLGGVDVALEVDQLQLERLVGELGLGLGEGVEAAAVEGLARLDDLQHPLLHPVQVLRGERPGDLEVVVEAVVDGRADAELGLREDVLHRLGEHVRAGVPQHVQPVRGVDGHRHHLGVGLRSPVQVAQLVAVADHDDGLRTVGGQPGRGDRGPGRRPGGDDDGVGHGTFGGDCGHGGLLGYHATVTNSSSRC